MRLGPATEFDDHISRHRSAEARMLCDTWPPQAPGASGAIGWWEFQGKKRGRFTTRAHTTLTLGVFGEPAGVMCASFLTHVKMRRGPCRLELQTRDITGRRASPGQEHRTGS